MIFIEEMTPMKFCVFIIMCLSVFFFATKKWSFSVRLPDSKHQCLDSWNTDPTVQQSAVVFENSLVLYNFPATRSEGTSLCAHELLQGAYDKNPSRHQVLFLSRLSWPGPYHFPSGRSPFAKPLNLTWLKQNKNGKNNKEIDKPQVVAITATILDFSNSDFPHCSNSMHFHPRLP